jgi:NADP-dependent 3-hydroxy acid dehydrogenase YdfG
MPKALSMDNRTDRNAYIATGPTSGTGCATALELAKHGTVVLVGRDAKGLNGANGSPVAPRSCATRESRLASLPRRAPSYRRSKLD